LADLRGRLGGQVDGAFGHVYSALRSAGRSSGACACAARFFFQSAMAALIASSASTEQWILTGGSDSSWAICVFLMVIASSTDLPFTHSVTSELEAMADPQPNVLNLASWILPSSPIFTCSRMTSPQAGAPTRPVPTLGSDLSRVPTFLGFS